METSMARKVSPKNTQPYPLDWLIRFGQSLVLTALVSFTLSILFMVTLTALLVGLFALPGLSSFAIGVTGTILHVLSVFGGGEWWRGILIIAIPITGVSVLFDAFVFLQNHGQEAWGAWHRAE